jgi:hypothetical protein
MAGTVESRDRDCRNTALGVLAWSEYSADLIASRATSEIAQRMGPKGRR